MSSPVFSTTNSADQDLRRRVISFLTQQNMRALRELQVEAYAGTVVLRGHLSSFYEKQLCLNCCRHVAGVMTLVDNITVSHAHHPSMAV